MLLLFSLLSLERVISEEITVAAFDGAAPIVFRNESGEAAGVMPELLDQLLHDLGHEARFVTGLSFNEAFEAVAAGEIDLLPGAVHSKERALRLDFNKEPIVVAWGQLGVLPKNDFDGLLELRNQRIGLMREGQNAANFSALMKQFDIPFVPVYYESFAEITEAIEKEEVAAGVFFNAWFRGGRAIVPSSIVFSPTQGMVATAKGSNSELLHSIDKRLVQLKEEQGSYYYQIIDRWFSRNEGRALPRWAWVTGASILGALLLAVLFLFSLRRQVARATAAVEESRERYRMVADYAHGWEFWTDPGGDLVYISPNTKEITGYSAAQFRDDTSLLERIILPEDTAIWKDHMREIHKPEARSRSSCTFRIRTKSGEVRWIEHRCTSITSSKGVYLGRRGSNIDITDQLLQQQTLEQNLREKELMLQEIHHRVKNNLQVVSSLISLQKHAIQDQEILDHLDSIAGRISTMGTLHSTIYREDSFGRVNMKEYIESIIAQLDTTAFLSAGIALSLSVAPIELELSEALPCGLIINEATTNAFKYAFPEVRRGEIWIELSFVTAEMLRLSIADNGVGLPPDNEDSSVATRGIGFELITALADQLGGKAEWQSENGVAVQVLFPHKGAESREPLSAVSR